MFCLRSGNISLERRERTCIEIMLESERWKKYGQDNALCSEYPVGFIKFDAHLNFGASPQNAYVHMQTHSYYHQIDYAS